jgi:hypothetical protein
LKMGQHLMAAEHTPLANLWLTLMNRSGIAVDKIGDSTAQFAEI